MSTPELNDRPTPVKTMTRAAVVSSSWETRLNNSSSKALSRSGRLKRRIVTWSAVSTWRTSSFDTDGSVSRGATG